MKYVGCWRVTGRTDGNYTISLFCLWLDDVCWTWATIGGDTLCVALWMGAKSTGKPDLTDKWTESKNNVIMAWKLVRSFNITPFTIRTSLISQRGLVKLCVITANRHSGVGLHNNQFTTQAFAQDGTALTPHYILSILSCFENHMHCSKF